MCSTPRQTAQLRCCPLSSPPDQKLRAAMRDYRVLAQGQQDALHLGPHAEDHSAQQRGEQQRALQHQADHPVAAGAVGLPAVGAGEGRVLFAHTGWSASSSSTSSPVAHWQRRRLLHAALHKLNGPLRQLPTRKTFPWLRRSRPGRQGPSCCRETWPAPSPTARPVPGAPPLPWRPCRLRSRRRC